ncbi:MAG: sugar ABC transporter permease, partial [Clostridiales bacterium]|nr:sugar ABC transporter permease [Clostridiales bacterium]
VGVLVFFILPFLVVMYYSAVDNPINAESVWFDNFINVLKNGAFKLAAKNTILFSASAVPLAVIFSLFLAMLLDSKIPFLSQFRTAFLSPMMVPVASVVLIWQIIFHFNGTLNLVLTNLGFERIDWIKSEYNRLVIVVLFLWKNLGYNMILFLAALGNIPKDLLEVSLIDGAGPIKQFFYIKLRYLSPTILFVTIISLINSFKVFREVYLLAGSYPFEGIYFMQHFMNNTFESLDFQKLSAAAVIMSAVMMVIIGLLFIVENYVGKDVEG